MRAVIFLSLIFLLPFIAALGHDLYMAYEDGALQAGDPIKFSDLGWVWKEYSLATYTEARAALDEETWKNYVSPVLRTKSILVTSVFPAFIFSFLLITKILGIWPFYRRGLINALRSKKTKKSGKFSFDGSDSKKKTYKYKRK